MLCLALHQNEGMKYDRAVQSEAVFAVSIVFIYIQSLCYCSYVITRGCLSHYLGAGSIWKFKSNHSSYCEVAGEKKKYIILAKRWLLKYIISPWRHQKKIFLKKTPLS